MSADPLEQAQRQLADAQATNQDLLGQLVAARQERDAYAAGLRECESGRLALELRLERIGERARPAGPCPGGWCARAQESGEARS